MPTDKEMLDWLDKQGRHYKWNVQLETDWPQVRDCVFVTRNSTGGFETIREAIAAKMGVEK